MILVGKLHKKLGLDLKETVGICHTKTYVRYNKYDVTAIHKKRRVKLTEVIGKIHRSSKDKDRLNIIADSLKFFKGLDKTCSGRHF